MKNSIQLNRILILGVKGMLGRELAGIFNGSKPILWDKSDLDITNCKEVRRKISELKPDIIINAAAYTAVDDCETNKELAMKVNGEAVKYLAESANEVGAVFIHYSTDYVFDGKNSNGYQEDDIPQNPVNVYGESKLLGEKYILDIAQHYPNLKYYLIRTSWLYGRNGKNFIETISELLKKRDQIKVVDDQHGKPTYAYDLAVKTGELLEGDYAPGIYHITNETENKEKGITWYDFANEIFPINREKIGPACRQAGENKEITPCASKEFPRPAKRPEWSALVNTKFPPTRNWKTALKEYLNG